MFAAAVLRTLASAAAGAAGSAAAAAPLLGSERPSGCLFVLGGLIFASFLLGRGLIALSYYSRDCGHDEEVDAVAAELAWAPRQSESRDPLRAPQLAPGPPPRV